MPSLENALQELRKDRSATQLRLEKLDQIIAGIESLKDAGASGKATKPKHTLSASARRKISLAQKARWASVRKQSQPVVAIAKAKGSVKSKRTISLAGRKRIAAAQRARWAKVRAEQKKAA